MITPLYIFIGILAVLIFAVVLVFAIAAARPNHFRVERSIEIAAPPAKIFPLLDDLKQQRLWSPWDQKDPDMKRTYSGPERGVGAKYAWDGDRNIGAGSQEIVAITPNERIDINIDFTRPFAAHNKIEFILRPSGSGTNLTWAIQGPMPLLFRAMGVIFSMDKMMRAEFDKGLTQIKALAEK